jgi:Methyltransferase domain
MTTLIHDLKKPLRRMKRRVLLELNDSTNFGKTDLIHFVCKKLNLRNYLELCTPISGGKYWDIHRWRFRTSRRLMYNCPDRFSVPDGLPIDFRIADFDIGPAVSKLKMDTNKIDICLVDGWHTYDCAIRDLNCTYELLAEGGVLVVHDCLPLNESVASPTYIKGLWNGVTYKAYVDFVLARDDLDYCTVDADHGCGIIIKNRTMNFMTNASSSVRKSKLASDWVSIHDDDKSVFRFFTQNHKHLLRLISAKTFVRGFGRNLAKQSVEI